MSTVTEIENTGSQAHFGFDTSKVFIGNNRYYQETFKNTTGGELTYTPGTVVGMITDAGGDDGKIVPMASGATNGSKLPVGVLKTEMTLAAGAEKVVSIAITGDVAEDKLIFDGSDDLDTTVDGQKYKYLLGSNTLGIRVVSVTELSKFDNQ